ncbi:MAG: protein-disulfide isomerase [Pseudomonas sp.]|nr:protein-disulfide isomerase [Pseudomonas sp.]
MSDPILHYLYDPFCGWCYGSAPMISAAMTIPTLHVLPHSVGMLSGDKSQKMNSEWRDFVRPHEERITFYSKQVFAEPYVQGVLEHQDVMLDSSPPTAAMLTAERLDKHGVEMLKRLQTAYYLEGQPIADINVIAHLAESLGYDRETFKGEVERTLVTDVDAHIAATNKLLERLSSKGFPAFGLEFNGRIETLPLGRYLTRPARFKTDIEQLLLGNPIK